MSADDIKSVISFLQNSGFALDYNGEGEEVVKAGILLFCRGEKQTEPLFMVVRVQPDPDIPHDNPMLQISMGHRYYRQGDEWLDSKEGQTAFLANNVEREHPAVAAIREGSEELGLSLANVLWVGKAKLCRYRSRGRPDGERKRVLVVPVMCRYSPADPSKVSAQNVAEIKWLTRDEYAQAGRADHLEIMDSFREEVFRVFREQELLMAETSFKGFIQKY